MRKNAVHTHESNRVESKRVPGGANLLQLRVAELHERAVRAAREEVELVELRLLEDALHLSERYETRANWTLHTVLVSFSSIMTTANVHYTTLLSIVMYCTSQAAGVMVLQNFSTKFCSEA